MLLFYPKTLIHSIIESSVQSLSSVQLFVTTWTIAHQASLSITTPRACANMSIESVMPSKHLILCRPVLLLYLIFPSFRAFSNESDLHIRWPNFRPLDSVSVLPMNIQDRFPLRLTGLSSLQSKGLSRVFPNTTVQNHKFFSTQLSPWSNSHFHT